MRLFHFSEDEAITAFEPRPLSAPVDESPIHLDPFPRACPGLVVWPTEATRAADRRARFEGATCRATASVEDHGPDRLRAAVQQRRGMPPKRSESVGDVGTWVPRRRAVPLGRGRLDAPEAALRAAGVLLRGLPRLAPSEAIPRRTPGASGVRTRGAHGRGPAGRSHPEPCRTVAA